MTLERQNESPMDVGWKSTIVGQKFDRHRMDRGWAPLQWWWAATLASLQWWQAMMLIALQRWQTTKHAPLQQWQKVTLALPQLVSCNNGGWRNKIFCFLKFGSFKSLQPPPCVSLHARKKKKEWERKKERELWNLLQDTSLTIWFRSSQLFQS